MDSLIKALAETRLHVFIN